MRRYDIIPLWQFHNFIMMEFKFKTLFERSVKTNAVPSWMEAVTEHEAAREEKDFKKNHNPWNRRLQGGVWPIKASTWRRSRRSTRKCENNLPFHLLMSLHMEVAVVSSVIKMRQTAKAVDIDKKRTIIWNPSKIWVGGHTRSRSRNLHCWDPRFSVDKIWAKYQVVRIMSDVQTMSWQPPDNDQSFLRQDLKVTGWPVHRNGNEWRRRRACYGWNLIRSLPLSCLQHPSISFPSGIHRPAYRRTNPPHLSSNLPACQRGLRNHHLRVKIIKQS